MLNTRFTLPLLCWLASLPFAGVAIGAGKQPLTIRDAFETTRFMVSAEADSIAISPDGRRYAAMLIRGDVDRDGVEVEIISGGLDSIEAARPYSVARLFTRALGATMHGDGDSAQLLVPTTNFPTWVDSDRLAFLWEDGNGVRQVAAANVTTRDWTLLTASPTDAANFAVGPDGVLVYEAKQPYSVDQSETLWKQGFTVKHPDAYSVLLGAADGASLKDVRWGLGERFVLSGKLDEPRKLRVVGGGVNTYVLSWPRVRPSVSPDGRLAIASGTPAAPPEHWKRYEGNRLRAMLEGWDKQRSSTARSLQQLFVISIEDAMAKPLWDAPMNHDISPSHVRWSPDSRSVFVSPAYLPEDSHNPSGLAGSAAAVVDVASGSYATLPVSAEQARGINDARWHGSDIVELQVGTDTLAFRRHAEEWVPTDYSPSRGITPNIRVELREEANTPPALYAVDERTGEEALVFDPNPALRTTFLLGNVEFIQWRDDEGTDWEGRLFFPVGYQPGRRYPLVVQTHHWGGREGFTLYGRLGGGRPTLGPGEAVYLAQPLANAGVVVLQVGSSPPGERWEEASIRMRGFVSGIEHLVAEGLADRSRVGIMGYSRSGWHAGYTLAFSDFPFAAAIVVDNIDSGYFEAAMSGWSSIERRNGAEPFGPGLKDWLERAPHFSVEHIRTPLQMMVTDSFGGRAAPLVMQWELFTRLRHLKKPVELWVAPNIDRGAHQLQNPTQLLAQQGRAMDWWLYWLKDERDPSEAKAEQYAEWNRLRVLRNEDAKRPKPPRLRWTVEEVQTAAH